MPNLSFDAGSALRRAALAQLADKRVLVTGGAGFIGSHIVDLLSVAPCREITVIDNMVRGAPGNLAAAMAAGNVRLIVGDIRDHALTTSLVEGQDLVFHQAALRITQCAAEPRAALDTMITATFDILERCVSARVPKVIMASSASVYGAASTFPTAEEHHPYDNRTLYGAAKAFAEGLLRSLNDMHGLSYVALRYFNVYGPRMDIHGRYTEVMIRWMERLSAGLPPIVFGDGRQTIDLVDVRDIAWANILAAASPASDVALNIGSGEETSLLELAGLLASAMGTPGVKPVHEPERSVNAVPRRLAETAMARRLIGFQAEMGREEGIQDLVAWWRETTGPTGIRRAAE